jgi:hypothetical protein
MRGAKGLMRRTDRWDGHAAERIVGIIAAILRGESPVIGEAQQSFGKLLQS